MRKLLFLAAAVILAALPAVPAASAPLKDASTTTPIQHVVWMMQDNHSFDNYFGTYPAADGIPQGVCQRLKVRWEVPAHLDRGSTRGCVQPFHLGDTPIENLSQGPGVQRRQYNRGQMDGFVAAYRRLGLDGSSVMGYYDGRDIPFHWNVADQYVLFDRFFASTTVGSREAYLYWVAASAPTGQTPLRTSAGYDALPTIFDSLHKRGISAKFYVENLDPAATSGESGVTRRSQLIKVPLLNMKRFQDGGALAGQVVDLSQYYLDLRNGTLPAVSYIVTTSSSENPPGDPRAGSRTLRKITNELMKSSAWSTSAFMWTYDGWGGWYDHVPPPKVDNRGYGFRVPALLVSPYAKRSDVNHTQLDYTAMLHFIETNWNLAPLSTRDQQSAGLLSAFDFAAAPRPPASLPWIWPAPRANAATDSPSPVIYAVYGVAAALAIAIVSLAASRRPITVPVSFAQAADLVRSSLRSVQNRIQRASSGGEYASSRLDPSDTAVTARSSRWRTWHRANKQVLTESPNRHDPVVITLRARDEKPAAKSEEIWEWTVGDAELGMGLVSGRNATPDLKRHRWRQTQKPTLSQRRSLSSGQRRTLNGSQWRLLNGSQRPLNRSQRPLNRGQRPLNGTQRPLNGTQLPLNGTQRPINGTQLPLNRTRRPVNGTRLPLNLSQRRTQSPSQRRPLKPSPPGQTGPSQRSKLNPSRRRRLASQRAYRPTTSATSGVSVKQGPETERKR